MENGSNKKELTLIARWQAWSPYLHSLLRIADVLDIELWELVKEASSEAKRSSKIEDHPPS